MNLLHTDARGPINVSTNGATRRGTEGVMPPLFSRILGLVAPLVAVGVLLSAPGCAVSSYTTAHNLKAGKSSFWVAPQLMRIGISAQPANIPFVEMGTRYGVTDNVEVGARIGAGLQTDVKLSLIRPKKPSDRLTLSIAPGVGYIGNFSGTPTGADGDDLHFFGATVPLYATWRLSDTLDVTLGPRVATLVQYVETSSASTTVTMAAGTSLSVAWKVTPGLTLIPEIAVAMPFVRGLTGAGALFGTGDQRVLQLGLGFALGG